MASILASPMQRRALSKKIEDHQFSILYEASTPADKSCLLSTSAPHASSSLLVTPATRLDLHLDPNELQTAVKWWLGVDTARETSCSLCPDTALDWLGNHTATCHVTLLKDMVVKCGDNRAGGYDTHECITLPTKVEVKIAKVLKRPASTSPEQTL